VWNGANLIITNTTMIFTNGGFGGGGYAFSGASGTITIGSATLSVFNTGNGINIGANQTLIVTGGGLITNSYFKPAVGNTTVVITNGGTFAGAYRSRNGTNNRLFIGSANGSTSTLNGSGNQMNIGGSGGAAGANQASSTFVQVGSNGLITDVWHSRRRWRQRRRCLHFLEPVADNQRRPLLHVPQAGSSRSATRPIITATRS